MHDDETAVRATQEALMRVLVKKADTRRIEGLYADAERHYRRALTLAERLYDPQHPITEGIRAELARVIEAQSQTGEQQFL